MLLLIISFFRSNFFMPWYVTFLCSNEVFAYNKPSSTWFSWYIHTVCDTFWVEYPISSRKHDCLSIIFKEWNRPCLRAINLIPSAQFRLVELSQSPQVLHFNYLYEFFLHHVCPQMLLACFFYFLHNTTTLTLSLPYPYVLFYISLRLTH